MAELFFALLLLGGLMIVFSGLPSRTGDAPRPDLRAVLTGGLRAFERQADRLPWVGRKRALERRRALHRAVRDRLPSFWGDVGIYLREGRKDLRGAVLAAIDRLQDPLSQILSDRLRKTHLGAPLDAALRDACREIAYPPFTAGMESLLSALSQGGDLVRLLEVLREQAAAQMSYEKREQAATLETRLIVVNYPFLFLALMAAVFVPIALSAGQVFR